MPRHIRSLWIPFLFQAKLCIWISLSKKRSPFRPPVLKDTGLVWCVICKLAPFRPKAKQLYEHAKSAPGSPAAAHRFFRERFRFSPGRFPLSGEPGEMSWEKAMRGLGEAWEIHVRDGPVWLKSTCRQAKRRLGRSLACQMSHSSWQVDQLELLPRVMSKNVASQANCWIGLNRSVGQQPGFSLKLVWYQKFTQLNWIELELTFRRHGQLPHHALPDLAGACSPRHRTKVSSPRCVLGFARLPEGRGAKPHSGLSHAIRFLEACASRSA